MEHKFNVIQKRWLGKDESTRCVKTFDQPGEAMDYVMSIEARPNSTWELVVEGGFCDGINANTTEKSFEYENTHNGDIKEVKYYIEHEVIY